MQFFEYRERVIIIHHNAGISTWSEKQPPEVFSFIKKETLAQVFSFEFCEISRNSFFTEHLRATASVRVMHQQSRIPVLQ